MKKNYFLLALVFVTVFLPSGRVRAALQATRGEVPKTTPLQPISPSVKPDLSHSVQRQQGDELTIPAPTNGNDATAAPANQDQQAAAPEASAQTQTPNSAPVGKSSSIWWVLVLVALAGVGFWLWLRSRKPL